MFSQILVAGFDLARLDFRRLDGRAFRRTDFTLSRAVLALVGSADFRSDHRGDSVGGA